MKKKITSLVLAGTLALGLAVNAAAASAKDFTDVQQDAWYYKAVDHVTRLDYFSGVSPTLFAPNQKMTRGMAVTVLSRVFSDSMGV